MKIDKILLTGKNGFLGKEIFKQLSKNYHVDSLGRSKDNSLVFSLTNENINFNVVSDLVIHCAGKAHEVPNTEAQKQLFFDVNVKGTENLLAAFDRSGSYPKYFVFISSVAVYGADYGINIKETDPLNARDAYGISKIQAEQIIIDWCKRNDVICSILRLPLVVGNNPPGNLGAMIKGIKRGYYFNIDGGKAKKSMVLASDVAKIIPIVSRVGGTYNLTDGYNPSFNELSYYIAKQVNVKRILNIPIFIAKVMAFVGNFVGSKSPINTNKLNKITADLTFDDSLVRKKLGWNPSPVLYNFNI